MVSEDIRILINRSLDALPESATLEDVMERLQIWIKIERGIAEVNAGKTIPHEEIERHFGLKHSEIRHDD